ncbi:MAG: hypothetical protein KAQ79_10415 [Cyclobacteriaceae bacterium]|nr:hypothetical protein [Cyclobacteriaceae bacterium]
MTEILNGKEYIRKLINIAHLSIGIPLLFFIWVYLESTAETLNPIVNEEYKMMVFIPVFIFSILLIVWGHKKYNIILSEARESDPLSEKLKLYQRGTTIRFVTYSISSILISIGFFLTDFQVFAALFGIMIVLFSINNPNARKVVRDLKLVENDKDIILKGLDIPNN